MEPYLEEFKRKVLEVKKAGKLAMFSHSSQHVAYKEIGSDAIHVRYVCPCGHKAEIHEVLKQPYKIKCPVCKKWVWKSKLKKKRGKKKAEPVAI